MTESEFLEHLGKRLHVLKENERDDILSEYAQHIEMKMKSGLSEEAAIHDFGDLEELAADILDAYHVDPDYNKKTVMIDKGRLGRHMTAAGNKIGGLWKCWTSKAKHLVHSHSGRRFPLILRCFLVFTVLFLIYLPLLLLDLYISDILYSYLSPPFDTLAAGGVILGFHLFYLFFAVSVLYNFMQKNRQADSEVKAGDSEPAAVGSRRIKTKERLSALGRWIKNLFVLPGFSAKERAVKPEGARYYMKKLWNRIKIAGIWLIRLIVLGSLAPLLLFTLFLLVACGTLIVLSVIGYPVIGLTVLSLGGLISGFSFLCIVCCLLFPRKMKRGIIIFFAGLLLMGIGGGVSFAEFSTFQYGGEKKLNGELATVVLQKTLPENVNKLTLYAGRYDLSSIRVEADSSLPDHQISVELLCKKELITPYMIEQGDSSDTEKLDTDRSVHYLLDYTCRYLDNELSTFFQVKDILLEGLKNRMIYSFNNDYVQEVVVKAAPGLAERITLE